MSNPIQYTTVRDAGDELHIEARFADGQKYVICTIEPEFDEFAHWLSDEINGGNVPCFSKGKL